MEQSGIVRVQNLRLEAENLAKNFTALLNSLEKDGPGGRGKTVEYLLLHDLAADHMQV